MASLKIDFEKLVQQVCKGVLDSEIGGVSLREWIERIQSGEYVPGNGSRRAVPETVTEYCPHCDSEVSVVWDTDRDGHSFFCPKCGERISWKY